MALIGVADYFSNGADLGMKVGDQMLVVNTTTNAVTIVTVAVVTAGGAASIGGGTFEVTATAGGTVPKGTKILELNHASVIAAATIADAADHAGLFIVTNTSATGTAAHTLTLTAGTFNSTGDNVATLNALDEALVVWFDDAGNGTVISNEGAVALA
jgi:hypothetical protein